MLTLELYAKYKKHFTDDQICKMEDMSRTDLAKFKDQYRILTLRLIPDHLLKEAERLGIHPDTIMWRMKNKKWSMHEACTTPKEEHKLTQEQLNQANEKYGLAPSTVYRRINRGWTIEKALNTPNNYRQKKSLPNFMKSMKMGDLVKVYRITKKDISVYEFIEELREYE